MRPLNVRFGSLADIFCMSDLCPLYPQKRTLADINQMSAKCQ